MLHQNLIISLPTYPKFCWYATGTTHIFHLGLTDCLNFSSQQLLLYKRNMKISTALCTAGSPKPVHLRHIVRRQMRVSILFHTG